MAHTQEGNQAPAGSPAPTRHVAIVGAGYVGLSSAVCLADLGHRVTAMDIDAHRVDTLQQAVSPIFEEGLDELLAKHRSTNRLRFTTSMARALKGAEFVFLCVATPAGADGAMDLAQVRAATVAIAEGLPADQRVVIVIKSTLPVGTGDEIEELMRRHAPAADFTVVSNPEFLREGRAVYDVFHPDRIVIGATEPAAAAALSELYADLPGERIVTDRRSAELIKQASNAFLATKISFANQLAELCERVGADASVVAHGMELDPRIAPGHLSAGLGYGGSCLPKDVEGLRASAAAVGVDMRLLATVQEVNRHQRARIVERLGVVLGGLTGKNIAIWGLAFKEGTDDVRDSPALGIINLLREAGVANIRAYDPQAMGRAMTLVPVVHLSADPYDAAADADAIVLTTAWPEFGEVDLARVAGLMRGSVLLDGRNQLDEQDVRAAGLQYLGIGRRNDQPAQTPPTRSSQVRRVTGSNR